MKKLIYVALLLSLTACKKDKLCYKCIVSNYYPGRETVVTSETVCDMSKQEIMQYEKQHTIITTTGNITYSTVTKCEQK